MSLTMVRTLFSTLTRVHPNPLQICRQFSSTPENLLHGIRVLDLTRIVAGPYCTMILGDMGADVIKVENPHGGDESRKWGPPYVNNTTETCYFASLNRNKRSICVDFKSSQGVQVVKKLASQCDVLIENYVPGKLEKIGLGYEELRKEFPRLVYCSLTGYGPVGPYKNRPGYDVIAASIGGFMHITGPRDGYPCKAGVAMTDIATGLYAHGAILAALLQRQNTGKGQKIDCNLLSTQLACLINIGGNYLNAGEEGGRWGSAHASIVPYKAYRTSDERYITVGTGSDRQFRDLCIKLNLPDIAEDTRFVSNKKRVKNRTALDGILEEQFRTKTMRQWEQILGNASFPNGPVNTLKEAFSNVHVENIGLVKEVEHPVAGNIKMVGPSVGFSGSPSNIRLPPPMLGQHTSQVLQEFGFTMDEIRYLSEQGAIAEGEVPVRLKLQKPKPDKKVNWTEETVDNEHLNKKKSKCCCIYKKPRAHLDSSSSEDEHMDCDDCRGHVEKKLSSHPPPESQTVS